MKVDGKWGYIDKTGAEVIPCKYDDVNHFSAGLAAVRVDGKWGYIDKMGVEVIPCTLTYNSVGNFEDDLAPVELNSRYGFIDKTGREVVPCKYTGDAKAEIPNYAEGLWRMLMTTADYGLEEGFISVTKREPTQPSPAPSPSSDPSATPSAAPSDSPSPSPSTKPSGGGSSGYRPSVVIKPVESPTPSPSQPPVEPSEVPVTPASELFDDVVKGSWYEPGVTYVVIQGLFKGMDVGVFSPDTNMTRAMVMTVLARMDGQDTTNATNGPWHTNIMNWAKTRGISDGTMPDSSVTREQLVTLLYRYAKPADAAGDLTAYADGNSVSAWAERAMVWAVNQEIITGKNGGRLDPQGFATRAEVATIFQRFVEKTQPNSSAGR